MQRVQLCRFCPQELPPLADEILLILGRGMGSVVVLCHPKTKQVARLEYLIDCIRSKIIGLNLLADHLALVTLAILVAVAFQSIEVVHPPVGGHDHAPAFLCIAGKKAEGQGYVQFMGVVPFCDQDVAGEFAVVLESAGQSRPEASSCHHLPIVSPAVVVRTDISPGSHVRLPLDEAGDQKGVVVVLLMAAEDQITQQLTTAYGGVVSQNGVYQACPILGTAVIPHDETDRLATIENT
ncbi:hypothetical protein SDC9_107348 [bioreactor metagenome]|uniref:Uncharacterized protein n=1 Tax=bioreactor metagenome TaxID=1076179 RepID=A0A645B526_9ZZZZ